MKLSDVKGERTLDVIADLIEPISNIAEDNDAAALFRKEKTPEGKTPRAFLIERMKKSVPKLMKSHKQDIVSILATIEGVSEQEYYESLNLVKLTKDAIELITDKAFIELFISAQTEDSSGSAQESTTEAEA